MVHNEITQYIAEINRIYKAGNATEHTYRPALKCLLEKMTNGLTVTNNRLIICSLPITCTFNFSRAKIYLLKLPLENYCR